MNVSSEPVSLGPGGRRTDFAVRTDEDYRIRIRINGKHADIDVISSGNTTVTIPVTIGNIQAIRAAATLVRKGSLTLSVNGSAFIDVRVTSFEKRFEQSREFHLRDFAS